MMRPTLHMAVLAAALAAALATAAEPLPGENDSVDGLLTDIDAGEKARAAAAAKAATLAAAERYRWDGKESVADYAKRVGIEDVQMELDLGSGVTMKLTLVPAGRFMMGGREAEIAVIDGVPTVLRRREEDAFPWAYPQREVTISRPFYMGVYEVTQEQYLQVMNLKKIEPFGHKKLKTEGKNYPANLVGFEKSVKFCEKVSASTGKTVTLPTEAQWEYACRAGTTTRYWFGDDEDELFKYANYDRRLQDKEFNDGFDDLAPVGSFPPNQWGLYDMHGNVAEHCSDWMGDDIGNRTGETYANAATLDPTGPVKMSPDGIRNTKLTYHVFRSGLPSAQRPYYIGDGGGLRVVVPWKQPE